MPDTRKVALLTEGVDRNFGMVSSGLSVVYRRPPHGGRG